MAVVNPTIERLRNGSIITATYAGMANGDTGAPLEYSEWADRSIQLFGTFGTGGTMVWQGSNDGTNWETLTAEDNTAISLTATALVNVTEIPRFARPSITAGDGTTSLTVIALLRRPTDMRQ